MPDSVPRKLLLLVEDNSDEEALAVRALEKCGVPVRLRVARDGAEALAMLSAPDAELPDLVFLDIKLPKIDGIEVLRRLRADARMHSVPIVILTSSLEDHDLAEGYRRGANSYIRKPLDYDRFSEVIKVAARYWLLLNQLPRPG